MKKALFLWNELKSSFWFIPILIMMVSVVLAVATIYIDSRYQYESEGLLKFIFTASGESARSVLSVISGAMIGVAGTVFSITLVALTLATSQFGPRLLRNFMHERINQVVLGTYVSTYVYCLLVLNVIEGEGKMEFLPTVSVFVAIIAAVANIVLLIVFIHHISMSIQADKVISDISESLSEHIQTLFPEKMGEEQDEPEGNDIDDSMASYPEQIEVTSDREGYLQYVDSTAIMSIAADNDILLLLPLRPGDYLVKNMVLIKAFGHKTFESDLESQLANAFIIGNIRTPQQDAEYAVHQMVEIASRALSPGVNDPYTAIACIDNLAGAMANLAGVKFPSKYRYDDEQKLRVISRPLNYEGMLNASFNQIRQFATDSPSVLIRLMDALKIIHDQTHTNAQKFAVQRHAGMVFRAAKKHIAEPEDFIDFEKRSGWMNTV